MIEGLEVLRQGIVKLLLQVSQLSEPVPLVASSNQVKLHPKAGDDPIEVLLLSSWPTAKQKQFLR